ncbi:uncharacterized protein LOC129922668 isoform X2 [Biomphalaria glabrata]|uniref:Uncharacterized protein LOC129922668 isoform X2 n=1 Tax=Biomphalaria glabrata TaxID=6526 RepID=A0A9W2YRF9_BIOGL|nr:uncharacterized protein LOC129922668 isoform X2 [Biomphalaria glabrata]
MILHWLMQIISFFVTPYLGGTGTDALQIYFEENVLITLYCPLFDSSNVDLYLIINNAEQQLYSCIKDKKPCGSLSNGGFAVFNSSGDYFQFNSTSITQRRLVERVICKYTYSNGSIFNHTEDVTFIAKAQDVNCFDTQLTSNYTNISITCMTSKIYPEALCIFNSSGQVSYSNVAYTADVKYYHSNCTWTTSLSYFYAGNYTLEVSFYPNVSNGVNFSTTLMTSFQLTVPNTHLSGECFNSTNITFGYIRPEATAICVCHLDDIGYPPAILKWTNSSNLDLGKPIKQTTSSLMIDTSSNNVEYTCRASTPLLNGTVSTSYIVKYAKGPTTCLVQFRNTSQTIWKICQNNIINWSFICQVNQFDAIPGIKGKIYIDSANLNLLDGESVTNGFQVKNDINITKAGNYSIICQVQNKYFDINAYCKYLHVLQVMAPPEAPPILEIINDADGLLENNSYTVVCRAPGGIPPVTNITLSCGNINESTQSGEMVTSLVTFTRNMTGQNCTCTAHHFTGCYKNNTNSLQPTILYRSTVLFFNATSTIIENGNYTQLFCGADGNPAPNISIIKGSETIANNSRENFLFHNKPMTCKDAGNYFCKADNGIKFNEDAKKLILFVKCPLQFATGENVKNFSLRQGDFFFLNLTIYGYPEPDKFKILKSSKESYNIEVTNSSMEPPYFIVVLKILKLKSTDFDNYTLLVFQNGWQNLTLNFIIIEANDSVIPVLREGYSNLSGAIGGGIAAGSIALIILITFVYLSKTRKVFMSNNLDEFIILKIKTLDCSNGEIYSIKGKMPVASKKWKKIESETYKNYNDIVPTITSATDVPKNMYKPKGDDLSDEKELSGENVYANQGFNTN